MRNRDRENTTQRHNATEASCGNNISFEILSWIPLYTLKPPSGHSVMERELFPVLQEMGDVF